MGPKKEPKNASVVQQPKVEEPPPIPPHELEGYGRFEYPNGIVYEGHWRLVNKIKVKHGQGELKIPGIGQNKLGEERYNGEWKNDQMDGYGAYQYASGAVYTGEWKQNKHHGKGTYEFPDGSVYQGEWKSHLMNGEGYFIDINGKKWEGEFAKGCYQSKMQNELRQAKEVKQKEARILTQSAVWFQKFNDNFAKSDKKTFKQNLITHFAVQQETKIHIKQPYPKFEDRPPEKWNQLITLLKTYTDAIVLRSNTEAKQLEPQRILSKQFQGLGQVVEFKYIKDERTIRASLCRITEQMWVLVFFHDSAEPQKKK